MPDAHPRSHAGFSMIEMVIVVAIIAIAAAIAVPRFADAGSGRRLTAAKRTLESDVQLAKRLARTGGGAYTLGFYPDQNMYVIIEGTEIKREAVVFTRDFDDEPFKLEISGTSLGASAFVVVTPYGELVDSFTVKIRDRGTEIPIAFAGRDKGSVAVTETDNAIKVTVGPVNLDVDLGKLLGP